MYKPSYSMSAAIVVTSDFQDNDFVAVTQELVTLAGEFIAICMKSSPLAEGYLQHQCKENDL